MEFRLDEEQLELQQTVAGFCETRFPLTDVGDREDEALDRTAWRELADLGIFGLLLPEDRGGVGLRVIDAAIVFEQLGGHLAPGPLRWSLLASAHIDGAAAGDIVVAGLEDSAVGDGSALVPWGADADAVIVLRDDGIFVLGGDRSCVALDALDPLGKVARVDGLDEAERAGDPAAADRARTVGSVLSSAMLVGIADRSLQVARDYALEREQFGVPIGSFQAVKHMLADMFCRASTAQSATYAAAALLDDPGSGEAASELATAKLLAADAALQNASTAIQVLGGMGFTWEMLPNYLLKRAWVLENEFGTRERHAGLLGAQMTLRGRR